MADAQLKAVITADDRASKVIAGVGASVDETKSKLQALTPAFKAIAAAGAIAGGALVLIAKNSISAAADYEQSQIAFTTMLGSAEKANDLLRGLIEFGKKTPFELPGLIESSKQLIAFGTAQKDVLPVLRQLGDIAAGVGIPVNELATLYGKAQVQGRLFAEDVNQLTGRGIPVIQEFAKQFGVSEGEVRKLVESGKIGFPQLQKAFANLTGEGSKFGGLMDAQSASFSGMLSNFKDGINEMMRQLGVMLLPYAKKALGELNNLFSQIPGWIDAVIVSMRQKIEDAKRAWDELTARVKEFKNAVMQNESVIKVIDAIKRSFNSVWETVNKNLVPAFQKLWGTVQQQLFPALRELLNAFSPLTPLLEMLAKAIAASLIVLLVAMIEIIAKVLVFVANLITGLAEITSWIIQKGAPVIKDFAAGIHSVAEAFMNLIDWVKQTTSAIRNGIQPALEEIKQFITDTWNSIKTTTVEIWSSIRDFFGTVWEGIVTVFKYFAALVTGIVITAFEYFGIDIIAVMERVKTSIQDAWTAIGNKFTEGTELIKSVWSAAWSWISTVISPIIAEIGQSINAFWDSITSKFNAATEGIKNIWLVFWQWLSDILSPIVEMIRGKINNLIDGIFTKISATDPIKNKWRELWDSIKNAVADAAAWIGNKVDSIVNEITSKINNAINAINRIAGKGAAAIGITIPQLPNIQSVNDAIISPDGKIITTHPDDYLIATKNPSGLGGGGGITINVYGDVSGQELIEKVKRGIMSELKASVLL